ncbi:hypothetical protein [Pararhodobacter sp.]|uniref:hypothetical protein n=1 Tax=Pararhodobacter sp. TaxID=2127056 RepID=UPI002AFF1301|nr:hypothetical protein [Pararhodobacter sp.]
MKMSDADQSRFPKVKYYVKNDLPSILEVPVIVKAINKIGEINTSNLKAALNFGSGPEIKFVDNLGACGEFSPGIGSNELRILTRLAEEFEAGKGKETTTDGKEVYVLGVTLLHELIHWGDDQDGINRPVEEGEEFEKAIYGKVIPC